jgi:FlaA1/EpsC-like NDP-sugar epimerase
LLPSAANVLKGHVRVSAQLEPERALEGRAGISEVHPVVAGCFASKRVLITGAGGSIGSEIARQVARLAVAEAILLDRDENSIFELQNQLAQSHPQAPIVPVVGDIRDRDQMRHVFHCHRPDVVLHAAAYKHVPVMEQNPCEAVLNNAFGTRQVLDLAIEFGAERFLMISTDKAVKPTSVMGATKRVAELVVNGRGAQ